VKGRVSALESLERERVGLAPAAAALLKERAAFEDGAILGPISDFIAASPEIARDVESFLGPMVHAVVVRDSAAADAVRAWHNKSSPGPLVLLPLDSAPELSGSATPGTLGAMVSSSQQAQRWVRALLGSVRPASGGGGFVDDRGAIWLPGDAGGPGPLRRRAQLKVLLEDAARAAEERELAAAASAAAHHTAVAAELLLANSAQSVSESVGVLRSAEDRLVDTGRRSERNARELAETESQLQRIAERSAALHTREREIGETLGVVASLEATLVQRVGSERAALAASQKALDEAREARSARQIGVAQVEARLQVASERAGRLQDELEAASRRISSLLSELDELSSHDTSLATQMAAWQQEVESRQAQLHDSQARLAKAEAAVHSADAEFTDAEHNLDLLRRHATHVGEQLHHAELRLTELSGRRSAIRERLETEWRRPLDEMLGSVEQPDLGDEELRVENNALREQLEALGPVNPFAIEEHAEEAKRVEFLTSQRADLAEGRAALQQAIKEIDDTARELFISTFAAIRENFRQIFMTLFGGGECDIRLENPELPLDCDIEIHASPRGKRSHRIHLLSSGERALVALSLLFGIFLTKPSPFCLLDEVDAPLDDQNIGRFVRMLNEFKGRTQFIVITHNPRTTTEAADAVYGVTMQEPGVSSLVSVRMTDAA
jgi:chromosome segregation protein